MLLYRQRDMTEDSWTDGAGIQAINKHVVTTNGQLEVVADGRCGVTLGVTTPASGGGGGLGRYLLT